MKRASLTATLLCTCFKYTLSKSMEQDYFFFFYSVNIVLER